MIYPLLKPLLFRADPEKAHERMMSLGRKLSKHPSLLNAVRALFYLEDERLRVQVGGLSFPNPIGLAAGFDKNAEAIPLFEALGFGSVEVGTVTPRGQRGNEKPRLFRLLEDKAIINRMGFNNDGVNAMAHRISGISKNIVLGINIGKNKTTPNEDALSDYQICLREAYAHGDYFTINISSPNTPGLRGLQELESLTPLLEGLLETREELSKTHGPKPLWLKLAPDLSSEELEKICGLSLKLKLDALVLTNTTLARPDHLVNGHKVEAGGLSGKPVRELSNEKLKEAAKFTGGKISLVGVGGVFHAKDVVEKLTLGASLVQIYSGLIYEGPGLIKEIKEGLLKYIMEQDFKRLDQISAKELQE